jgi:hypothetical protein
MLAEPGRLPWRPWWEQEFEIREGEAIDRRDAEFAEDPGRRVICTGDLEIG